MDKSSNLATLASVIKKAIAERLKEIHTTMPGIVETFDPVAQTASVQPAIKRIFKTNDGEKEILTPAALPILINVPVIFPRGGGFSLTFPVAKGDECRLDFCERSIDNWHQFGGIKNPGAKRFHSLSDATATVGLSSLPNKIPNYDDANVQLKKDDGTVEFTLFADGNARLKADVKVTLESPDVECTSNLKVLGNLEVIGDSTLSATVTSNGKDISDTHAHDDTGTYNVSGTPVVGTSGTVI